MVSCRDLLVSIGAAWMAFGIFGIIAVAEEPAAKTVPQVLNKFIASGEIPGAVTLVHQVGQPAVTTVVGEADSEAKTPMEPDTIFGIMSMTKPITATALLILVDEGKVSLDDGVAEYISAFKDSKHKNGAPIEGLKIYHLLTHTSGLTGKQECVESLAGTANLLAARPFEFKPGEKWEYGPSMNVVGRIIEIVSGKPYDEFVRERILVPLAMNDTTFHPTKVQRTRIASIYKKSKDAKSLLPGEWMAGIGEADSVPNPSGGLYSTAADMDRFYSMILNGGELDGQRIVSADAVRQMTTIQTGDIVTGFTPGNGWGLGWCVVREPQDVTGMLSSGTFGHGGKYGTQGWIDPVKQRIFVLMYQRSDAANSDGADIRKEFQHAAVDELEVP